MLSSAPSPYDVFFRIGPVPVRVSWTHWLGSAILGFNAMYWMGRDESPQPVFLILWLTIVFVSILWHELGHAFAARMFGYKPEVTLYAMGGYASYVPTTYSYGRDLIITLAGPAASFVLGMFVILFDFFGGPFLEQIRGEMPVAIANFCLTQLLWVNLGWMILNLMPVLPLDGGRACDVICRVVSPASGAVIARWIGVVAGCAIAFFCFNISLTFGGILFLMFAYQNYLDVSDPRRR